MFYHKFIQAIGEHEPWNYEKNKITFANKLRNATISNTEEKNIEATLLIYWKHYTQALNRNSYNNK